MSQQQRYYRPYDSADESGSDSDTASEESWFSYGMDQHAAPTGEIDGHPNFRAFASQVQLRDAAGRSFSTVKEQLTYGEDKLGKFAVYSEFEKLPPPDPSGFDLYGQTKFATADGTETSLILIDSRYRDRVAYPQPTLFTLRLPRIYKQVTNITLSDVKLLTSFYFFRLTKGNTDITVYEQGRQTYTYEGTYQSTIVKRYITTGSYNIDSLQSEIQLQLNYTPLFFDYGNGFSDFIGPFRASGDFSINFNFPGDYFYNNVTNLWVPNPTIDTITLHFWKTRYAGLSSYSTDQVLLAYYYPVINEYAYDEDFDNTKLDLQAGLGIDPTVTTTQQVLDRIRYYFTGINPPDPVVLAVVNGSRPVLDQYRLKHTFRYWLVNKYIVNRDTRSQNVYITTPSLNTSLVNLLNSQSARYLLRALQQNSITQAQYAALQLQVSRTLAVLQAMYNFEQTQFLNYFAVPWSQYALNYYANLDWLIFLRNGQGATGVPSNDSEAVAAGIMPYTQNILSTGGSNPNYYWPNMSNVASNTIYLTNLSNATSSFNLAYSMTKGDFFANTPIIDPTTSYIYNQQLTKSGNAVCPIQSGKYTVFKFHSPVRQTLQVETLPRPSAYRLPLYNQSNFNSNINYYYDLSYVYTFTPTLPYPPTQSGYTMAYDNLPSSFLLNVPGWTAATALSNDPNYTYGESFANSCNQYTSNYVLDVLNYNRALYFQFTTPEVLGASPSSNYTYNMNLSVVFYSNVTSPILQTPVNTFRMFIYHDRGGFQGDISGVRNENPIFYKYSTVISTFDTSGTISFTSYPKQTYYVSLRSDEFNYANVYPRVIPWFSSNFTSTVQTRSIAGINPATDICGTNFNNLITSNWNYAQVYDSNWIQLPINSNLWPPDPANDANNAYVALSNPPIGYDENNVSTDYTDYIPYIQTSYTRTFAPNCNLGIDPISKYLFTSNIPYNQSTQTFLDPDGLNVVLEPGATNIYSPGTVPYRNFKIVHYYSPNYLPESTCNVPLASGLIGSCNTAQLPYTISTTTGQAIPGYSYGGIGTQCNIQLGRGVLGFSFVPSEGVWDVKRIMFRSAIEDYENDPNQVIKYLGVYNMYDIINTNTSLLTLSSAICVLSNSARVTYTSTFTYSNAQYDYKGGSYYEFQKDTGFVSQTYCNILGYIQIQSQMTNQPESLYTCIAFTEYGLPTTIKALSGSAVPFPFYNNAYVSSVYLNGTKAYNSTFGVVYPSSIGQTVFPFATSLSSFYAPPTGNNGTQSQYVLSMPIGTSVVNYKSALTYSQDSNFLNPWTTTLTPSRVIANVSNYIMLQDTNFNIYDYSLIQGSRTFGTPKWQISEDQVFPTYEFTSLVSLAANSFHYYFLGFSNLNNVSNQFRLKRYDPRTGVLYDYPLNATFTVPIGGSLKSFTVNDNEQLVVSYQTPANQTYLYYNVLPSTNMTSFGPLPSPSTCVHAMDPLTSTIYYMPQNATTGQGVGVYALDINGTFPGTIYTPTGTGLPTTWSGFTVNKAATVPATNDRVFMYSSNAGYQSNVYVTSNWSGATWNMVLVSTPVTTVAGQGQPITTLANGFNAGLWLTGTQSPIIWANRNTDPDIGGIIESAWQVFYPFQKIVLEKLANAYNPITDLTYLDYPEYPHTSMFYYRTGAAFSNDTNNKWGLESNNRFVVSDPYMQGYYFNSYIYNVPVVQSSGANFQYLAIRGYSPTETSETLVRFYIPNKYDFGYVSQLDMINEIALLPLSPTSFNSNYAYQLSTFDVAFRQSNSYWGAGYIPNFEGSNFNSSNFAQFASNVSTIYQNYQSNAALLSSIADSVTSNVQIFVSSQLKYILPANALQRQNFTDPIVFSLLWKSGLLPQYRNLLENWGLGYNLGYEKIDTPFSTYHRATSFYKILEDYIYLRMNPEYQLNRMDTTFRENFKITRDSTGSIQNFHGKLILNNFNTFSQSFVFNNNPFNPPVGRLDSLYFNWVDFTGLTVDNNDCEWTASIVITESKSKATTGSTIPSLPPPKK